MKHSMLLALVIALVVFFVGATPATASTIWSQQWDTTPVNPPATIDQILIFADLNTGLDFGDDLTNFIPYNGSSASVSGWNSTLINPWEVEASGPAVGGQDFAFNINFGTPATTSGYLMFEYFYQGQLVASTSSGPNPQQWYYNGNGGWNT